MSSTPLLWLNGDVSSNGRVSLSLADAGFLWGAVVVDRLRTFRREVYRLPDHLRRFRENCRSVFVPLAQSDDELTALIVRLVAEHPAPGEMAVVLFATPGTRESGPTLGIQVEPIDFARYAPWVSDGVHLVPMPDRPVVDPAIKHRSRLAWWIAKQHAPPSREPLFISDSREQHIRETATANLLAVIDDHLYTPRHEALDGVSLLTVRELSETLSIPFAERPLPLEEVIERASECFLSSTTFCLAPVAAIGATALPNPRGPVFARLLAAWSDSVGVDIAAQFRTNR